VWRAGENSTWRRHLFASLPSDRLVVMEGVERGASAAESRDGEATLGG
jgi:hypothetical protein